MYWSRVGRPILMSSWTLTDSTTSMLNPYGSSCFWTSAISSTSQISPGILLCRAQTMLVTPGICLMSDSVILSLPSPYQRKPICIGIVFLSFVLNLRSRPAPGTERHLVTFHSSISIQVWQVVIYPFFWGVFCGLYLNKKNREKNLQFLTVDFSILTRIFKIGAELSLPSAFDKIVRMHLAGRLHRHFVAGQVLPEGPLQGVGVAGLQGVHDLAMLAGHREVLFQHQAEQAQPLDVLEGGQHMVEVLFHAAKLEGQPVEPVVDLQHMAGLAGGVG